MKYALENKYFEESKIRLGEKLLGFSFSPYSANEFLIAHTKY
jgi:hypothetical protein